MRKLATTIAGVLLMAAVPALPTVAQHVNGPGTPVDRGVADVSANAASQRVSQPGIGQFGVGSILLDRHNTDPHQPTRFDPFAGDSRVSHRYLMKAPGVAAMMNQTDYIGPSPRGGWTQNGLTYDGAEILTYSADTVFVLTPELLATQQRQEPYLAPYDHPNLIKPQTTVDYHAYMRGTRVTGQAQPQPFRTNLNAHRSPELARNPNYVHPEIIERRKRLKAEREAEAKAKEEAKAGEAQAGDSEEAKTEPAED